MSYRLAAIPAVLPGMCVYIGSKGEWFVRWQGMAIYRERAKLSGEREATPAAASDALLSMDQMG
jgi:hypothetical protein